MLTFTVMELKRLKRLAVSGPKIGVRRANWLIGAISVPLRTNMLLSDCSFKRYSGAACSITR